MKQCIEDFRNSVSNIEEVQVIKQDATVVSFRDMEMLFENDKLIGINVCPYGISVAITDLYVNKSNVIEILKMAVEFSVKIANYNKLEPDDSVLSLEGLKESLGKLGIKEDA